MELFSAVCEHKSINKTSIIHHVSQQGVSKMIRELEDELGCKLLIRSKQGVTPTHYGAYFLRECRAFLDKKNHICENITNITDFPKETLFLGMAYGIISALPNKILSDFEQKYPHITIEYSDYPDIFLENLMLNDELDMCVTTGVSNTERVACRHILDEHIYLCIPKNHRLFFSENIEMNDIKDHSFAMFSTQFHIRHNFMQVCRNAGFEPKIEIASSDFNSLKEIAINNNHLFVVPSHTISSSDNRVRYCKFPDDKLIWQVFVTKKKARESSEPMKLFLDFLHNA